MVALTLQKTKKFWGLYYFSIIAQLVPQTINTRVDEQKTTFYFRVSGQMFPVDII